MMTLRTCVIATTFSILLHIIPNDAFSTIAINSVQMHRYIETNENGWCLNLIRRRRMMSDFEHRNATVHATVDLLHTFPKDYNDTMIDEYFMDLALEQAQLAWKKNEVPIGAVIVEQTNKPNTESERQEKRTFRIISEAHNLVETNIDASAHAELLALRQGAQNLQNWRYPPNCTLYSTLEPCPMCLASAQAFRIDNIVYGAYDNRLGAIETHMNLVDVAKHPYHEIKSVQGCIRHEECGKIMVEFFRERRRMKKEKRRQQSKVHTSEDKEVVVDDDPTTPIKRKRSQISRVKSIFMSAIVKVFDSPKLQ